MMTGGGVVGVLLLLAQAASTPQPQGKVSSENVSVGVVSTPPPVPKQFSPLITTPLGSARGKVYNIPKSPMLGPHTQVAGYLGE